MNALLMSLAAMLIGYFIKTVIYWYRGKRRTSGQSALLHGFDGPTKFVFPPRENVERAILPRISTEDFMAINNVISAFINIKKDPPSKMVDSLNITPQDKKENNLILICSSKTNAVTAEALDLLRKANPDNSEYIPIFYTDPYTNKTVIRWNRGEYASNSFDQSGGPMDDMAIILKAKNPWASNLNILIVAGIRGIGTWGAAECLKKWWQPIYSEKASQKKKGSSKYGSFVALLGINYDEYDIKEAKLIALKDLDSTLNSK